MKVRTKQAELAEVQTRLAWWRGRYGGRGRPIPEELWAAATEVADTAGVNATARALGLNRARLARRVSSLVERSEDVTQPGSSAGCSSAFVELQAPQAPRGEVVVRLAGRGGEQMEICGSASDVATVVREVWRPR